MYNDNITLLILQSCHYGVKHLVLVGHGDMVHHDCRIISTVDGIHGLVKELGSCTVTVADTVENKADIYEDISRLVIHLCHKLDCSVIL